MRSNEEAAAPTRLLVLVITTTGYMYSHCGAGRLIMTQASERKRRQRSAVQHYDCAPPALVRMTASNYEELQYCQMTHPHNCTHVSAYRIISAV